MSDEDISGLELTVAPNKERGEGIKLPEDEWLPCVLTAFIPFENQWGKQLRWVFEVQGNQYTWKSKEGKSGQFKVNGSSSYACSPKSKLYKWYSKLTGKEPAEGEAIKLKSLIGIPCYVMIKINKGKDKEGEPKDYFNIDKLKARPVAGAVAPASVAVQAVVAVETPAPAVAVKEVVVEAKPVVAEIKAPTAPKTTANIFDDIF